MRKSCAAVIVAAGTASRMLGIEKMLVPLAGKPVLLRSLEALAASESIDRVFVVTREDLLETVEHLCKGEPKFCGAVLGGDTRTASVLRGLKAVGDTELIAIHDGARPLVSAAEIDRTLDAAERYGAAAPAIPVHDTIKCVHQGFVTQTPDRSTLYAVQTPQIFEIDLLRFALAEAREKNIPLTDDCSAVEALGKPVYLTEGSRENLKITVPMDLILAEAILKEREKA